MNDLFYYEIRQKKEPEINIKPDLFASIKTATIAQCYADIHSKFIAYNFLIENNFDVPKENDIWKIIDEPYEYYQDIPKNIQQSAHLPVQKEN